MAIPTAFLLLLVLIGVATIVVPIAIVYSSPRTNPSLPTGNPDAFIFTHYVSGDQTIHFPIIGYDGNNYVWLGCNALIDFGDGTSARCDYAPGENSILEHAYVDGTYNVTITGDIPGWSGYGWFRWWDKKKRGIPTYYPVVQILDIIQFGTVVSQHFSLGFQLTLNALELQSATDIPNPSIVSYYAFCMRCNSPIFDTTNWNMENVEDIRFMGCGSVFTNTSNWRFPNLLYADYAFGSTHPNYYQSCYNIEYPVDPSGWNPANLLTAAGMFSGYANSEVIHNYSAWSTPYLTTLEGAYASATCKFPQLAGWSAPSLANVNVLFQNYNNQIDATGLSAFLGQAPIEGYNNAVPGGACSLTHGLDFGQMSFSHAVDLTNAFGSLSSVGNCNILNFTNANFSAVVVMSCTFSRAFTGNYVCGGITMQEASDAFVGALANTIQESTLGQSPLRAACNTLEGIKYTPGTWYLNASGCFEEDFGDNCSSTITVCEARSRMINELGWSNL